MKIFCTRIYIQYVHNTNVTSIRSINRYRSKTRGMSKSCAWSKHTLMHTFRKLRPHFATDKPLTLGKCDLHTIFREGAYCSETGVCTICKGRYLQVAKTYRETRRERVAVADRACSPIPKGSQTGVRGCSATGVALQKRHRSVT